MTWLSVQDVAQLVKLSAWTLYQACESGELAHSRVNGRRTIRLTPDALDTWLKRHERPARA